MRLALRQKLSAIVGAGDTCPHATDVIDEARSRRGVRSAIPVTAVRRRSANPKRRGIAHLYLLALHLGPAADGVRPLVVNTNEQPSIRGRLSMICSANGGNGTDGALFFRARPGQVQVSPTNSSCRILAISTAQTRQQQQFAHCLSGTVDPTASEPEALDLIRCQHPFARRCLLRPPRTGCRIAINDANRRRES